MSSRTDRSTRDNGAKKGCATAKVFRFGRMERVTKVTGKMTWLTVAVALSTQMGMYTKVNG